MHTFLTIVLYMTLNRAGSLYNLATVIMLYGKQIPAIE